MIPALRVDNLTKTYANGYTALKAIQLQVAAGDFFALLGPNGAGKSTTIGIISSLVNKTSGKVAIFGHDLDTDMEAAKACIGLVPQEFNFNIFEKVEDILVNQAGYYGISRAKAKSRAAHYLKQLGLWEKRHQIARSLSGGMKRRLMIARALVHEPRLLILDEPTAGVDIELRRSMWDFLQTINQQGTTIILTTHYLEEAENLCKHIAILDKGQIIQNTDMKNLLQQLDSEAFILYLRKPIKHLPPLLANYNLTQLDDTTLSLELHKQQNLNDLFTQLSQHNIEISSLRNKANRLEELFIRLVHGE